MTIARKAASLAGRARAAARAASASRAWSRAHPEPDGAYLLLANTAGMRNLGDHAITLGELAFLERYFPSYGVVELGSVEWEARGPADVARLWPGAAAVLLQGGGHMGSLWGGGEEGKAMEVIGRAAGKRCAYLPQTAYFSDDDYGRGVLARRREFYREHPDVFFCLRDRRSYDLLAAEMPFTSGRTALVPDAALFLEDPLPAQERSGVTLCLRGDEERVTGSGFAARLEAELDRMGWERRRTDTLAPERFPVAERGARLEAKMLELKRSELVVTDRLHAMVLCAVTRTPCIAMDNVNGKVGGVHRWLEPLRHIRLAREDEVDGALMREVAAEDPSRYPSARELLAPEFDRMARAISDFTGLKLG